ncbi:hypothetical protein MNBD_CHLOROFLEXI01-510 [hydrothermal vent metagenome]|uniref:Uncharacterized protein n=1 Tax=hydrothermal vent metagenome TaxID=652676 RepID=A0A3B0VDQ2_9ZZZZ
MRTALSDLENLFTAKVQYFDYAVLTGEGEKMLAAVEEVDDALDFIDLHLEYLSFARDEDSVDGGGIEEVLLDHRAKFFKLFEKASVSFLNQLDDPGFTTPVLIEFKDELIGYLRFKLAANRIRLGNKTGQINTIAAHFHKVYQTLNGQGLQGLWEEAVKELKRGWPSAYRRLMLNWQHQVSFCDRSLLEQQDIFRVSQRQRHRVFHKLANATSTFSEDQARNHISAFFLMLRRRASGETAPQESPPPVREVYLMPALDRYLCARDLRVNMIRKWARFIPLRMSNYLIKVYNEPVYWDSTHLVLNKLDHQRLGFAYYQKAMEVGRESEYSEMLLKKALYGFRRAEVEVPSKLMEKLVWA